MGSMKTTLEPPLSSEREYTRLLLGYVRSISSFVKSTTIKNIEPIEKSYKQSVRSDGLEDDAQSSFDEILALSLLLMPTIRQRIVERFEFVDRWNYREWSTLIKQAVKQKRIDPKRLIQQAPPGVPVFEQFIGPLRDAWVAENVALVKGLSDRLAEEIASIIRREISGGGNVQSIKQAIEHRLEVTKARAKLIAEDQVFKLHSDLTMYRAQSVGSDQYIWRTMRDERVRQSHREREGKIFSWSKPPAGGRHPGQEIRCRCRAEPLLKK